MHSRAYLLLKKDLFQSEKEPIKGITSRPVSEDNLFQWEASVSGLSDTPWEGGVFKLSLVFDHSYNTRPPSLWFTTVPFHPNVHPDTGVPCCGLLQSAWSEQSSLQSLLLALQCLLCEPEMDEGCVLNPDAARLLWDSPHAYRQIALDCVVTSLRIDAGLPPFPGEDDDVIIDSSPTQDGRQSTASSQGRLSAKPKVKPKMVSFDDYHALWKGIATSQPLQNKKNPMISLLVRDPALAKVHIGGQPAAKNSELEKRLEQHHKLKYGNFKPPGCKEPEKVGSEFKERRMAELRDMYKTAISIPQQRQNTAVLSPVQDNQIEDTLSISVQNDHVDDSLSVKTGHVVGSLSIQTDHVTGDGADVDDLLQWTQALDKDNLENL
jgi:ubiquitin-conjugating enzyme E2 U